MSAALHTSCDRAIAAGAGARERSDAEKIAHPRLILATTVLASSLAFVDGSVINVGLPAVGRSLSASGASLAWVLNGYMLPLSALLLFGGALGDVHGRRRMLLFGIGLFAAASVVCMLATSLSVLLFGRVLQGVGAALLMPNSLAILGATFPDETRSRAIGIWAASGAAAGALAPVFGGWLIDQIGWRAIFMVNLPIAAAALYLAARFVPRERMSGARTLDLAGAALVSMGLTMVTWALTVGSSAEPLGPVGFAVLGGSIACLMLFLLVERRRGDAAMLPLALFASRTFVGLNVLTLLLYGALSALLVAIPFVLIQVRQYSAAAAGAALLPLPLAISLTSPAMGRMVGKLGARLPLTIGPLVVAGGCVLAVMIGTEGGYWRTTFPPVLVISVGMSLAVAPLTSAVLGSVEKRHVGVASGFNSAVARTGGLLATALLSMVLAADGANLLTSFRIVAVAAAVACVAAALSARAGLRTQPRAG